MASQQELTDARNTRFLDLLKPVYGDCERWAFYLAKNSNDAEDVFSESIKTGLEKIHQLKNDGAFKTWMFRIIANTYRLWLRSNKRQPEAMAPEILTAVAPREEDLDEQARRAELVRQALSKLSEEQRQGLVLFEMENFSIREISRVMGKKEGAIRVLLTRARQRLAALLTELNEL